jgi:hypothetical protein
MQQSFEVLSSHLWTLVASPKTQAYASRIRTTLKKKGRICNVIGPLDEIPENTECVVFLLDPYPHCNAVVQQVDIDICGRLFFG